MTVSSPHGRWRSLRDPHQGLAYLRQSVVNRSRSVLRHRGVQRRYDVAHHPASDDVPGADEGAADRESRRQLLENPRGQRHA